jgi:hypothetical protein
MDRRKFLKAFCIGTAVASVVPAVVVDAVTNKPKYTWKQKKYVAGTDPVGMEVYVYELKYTVSEKEYMEMLKFNYELASKITGVPKKYLT